MTDFRKEAEAILSKYYPSAQLSDVSMALKSELMMAYRAGLNRAREINDSVCKKVIEETNNPGAIYGNVLFEKEIRREAEEK